MRLHRFFIQTPIEGDALALTDQGLLHQWRSVLRLKTGERVVLFDGSGYEFTATIRSLEKEEAHLSIEERRAGLMPEKNLWLFVALVKKDKFEWVAEKAAELGVSHLVPVIAAHSEKKGLNEERLRKIITEATEQSGRGKPMSLHGTFSLSEALSQHKFFPLIAGDPGGANLPKNIFDKGDTMGVFIGPEGGWSDGERALFESHKVPLYSLGEATLRAETAAIAVATRLLL